MSIVEDIYVITFFDQEGGKKLGAVYDCYGVKQLKMA